MDGRGGGCIARYSGSGGGFGEITYGMSKVERIMLKFRPIAPKPMAAGSGSSSSTADHSDGYGKNRRRKRRYVRVNGNKKKKDSTNTGSKKKKVENSGRGDAVVTLSLMPETPDRKENSPPMSSPSENPDLLCSGSITNRNKQSPILLSFNNQQTAYDGHLIALRSPSPQKSVVTSFVTMECVTDTLTDGHSLVFTDQARVMSMEMDTCPSFVTNSRDTVVWTNKAYREMTGGGGSPDTVLVVVEKFNKVTMPVSHPAFTCQVKVTWGGDGATSPSSVTAPCDVWRLRSGGYAWRLDVKAALCLGRYI